MPAQFYLEKMLKCRDGSDGPLSPFSSLSAAGKIKIWDKLIYRRRTDVSRSRSFQNLETRNGAIKQPVQTQKPINEKSFRKWPRFCKLPSGYNGVPPHSSQNYLLPWTNPQTQLPASSLDPSDLPSQTAFISGKSFCHNSQDRQDRQIHTQLEVMSDDYRPLSLYRERRGLIIICRKTGKAAESVRT